MFNKLSYKCVQIIYNLNNMNDKEQFEILQYGIEVILSTVTGIISVLILSIFINSVIESIIFLVIFAMLRTYTGGYHAKNHLSCILILNVNIVIGVAFSKLLEGFMLYISAIIMSFIGNIIITIASPVVNENHQLSKRQIEQSKKFSQILLMISNVVIILLFFVNKSTLSFMAAFSLFSISISIIIAKFERRRAR